MYICVLDYFCYILQKTLQPAKYKDCKSYQHFKTTKTPQPAKHKGYEGYQHLLKIFNIVKKSSFYSPPNMRGCIPRNKSVRWTCLQANKYRLSRSDVINVLDKSYQHPPRNKSVRWTCLQANKYRLSRSDVINVLDDRSKCVR